MRLGMSTVPLKGKLPVSPCFPRDDSRVSFSNLLIRESRLARITEAEILEYYGVCCEKKTTDFLAHLSCGAFIHAIFKTRANSGCNSKF